MKKDHIQAHHGDRNQLNGRKFPDYGIAVGHHKRHREQEEENLLLSYLAELIPDLF